MSPGWADVRNAVIADSRLAAAVVAELGRDPGNGAALAMASLVLDALESLGEIGRRWVIDEAVLARAEKRAFDEGFAAGHALRGRLSVVSSA